MSPPLPPGIHPDDQPETVDLPTGKKPTGKKLTLYFRPLPPTWDPQHAPQLHECRTCGAAVSDTANHAYWHTHSRV